MSVILDKKRISTKLIAKHEQRGGYRTAEIDAALDDPNAYIPVTWEERRDASIPGQARRKKWAYQNDSWFDYLDINNEYLVEKCEANGITDPDTLERVRTWGSVIYDTVEPVRQATGDELYLTTQGKYTEEIPDDVKTSLEEYSKITRKVAKDTVQKCNLKYHTPERQQIQEAAQCQALSCDHRRTVNNQDDLDEILRDPSLTPAKRRQYAKCGELQEFCKHPDNRFPPMFQRQSYRHITNSGVGDCLFIAVARYLDMGQVLSVETGQGMAVKTMDGNYHFPDHVEIEQDVPKEHKINVPGEDKDKVLSNRLRVMTVEWLRDNPNYLITGSGIVKHELAISFLDNNPSIIPARQQKITLIKYFKEHEELGNLFKAAKNHKSDIQAAKQIVESEPPADKAEAVEHFITFLNEQYLERMSDNHVYAGPQEVIALSQVLRVNILIVQSMGDALVYNMGGVVPDTEKYMTIYHNVDVQASGGFNHYEIMYPEAYLKTIVRVKPSKLKLKLSEEDLSVMYSVVSYCGNSSPKTISPVALLTNYKACLQQTAQTDNILKMLLSDMCDKLHMIDNENLCEITVDFVAKYLPQVTESVRVDLIMELVAYLSQFYDQDGGYPQANLNLELLEEAVHNAFVEMSSIKQLYSETTGEYYFQQLIPEAVSDYADDGMEFMELAELWAATADLGRDDSQIIRSFIEDTVIPHIVISYTFHKQTYETDPQYIGLQLPLTAESLLSTYKGNYAFMDFSMDQQEQQEQQQQQEQEQQEEEEISIISDEYVELYSRLVDLLPMHVELLDDDSLSQIEDAAETMGMSIDDIDDELLAMVASQILEQ